MSDTEKASEVDQSLRKYGYLDGNYTNRCVRCNDLFVGAKRCSFCKKCALREKEIIEKVVATAEKQLAAPDLLNCPFCASDKISVSQGGYGDGSPSWYVECENCAATADGGGHGESSADKAVENWNMRYPKIEVITNDNLKDFLDRIGFNNWCCGCGNSKYELETPFKVLKDE